MSAAEASDVELCLLRHAHAGDPLEWAGPDEERPLSSRGRKQAERLGRLLAEIGFAPTVILSSPKRRAMETAQIVASALDLPMRTEDGLGYGPDLADVERLLTGQGNPLRPLLVGHDPEFSEIASGVVGAPILVPKGTLIRIDAPRPLRQGSGALRWMVPPDLLKPER